MHFTSLLAAMVVAAGTATAHMNMATPPPLEYKGNPHAKEPDIDYSITSPISGAQFPCKNYLKLLGTPEGASVATYAPGQQATMTISGGAYHNGGSCQLSLSYDKGKTFTVIKSFIGGCPTASGGTFAFTVPQDAPEGDDVVFAWTWVNKTGNREFYMSCAVVTIKSGGGSTKRWQRLPASEKRAATVAFKDRPQVFQANLGGQYCTKEGVDTVYPEPGPDVENKATDPGPAVYCKGGGPAPTGASADSSGSSGGSSGGSSSASSSSSSSSSATTTAAGSTSTAAAADSTTSAMYVSSHYPASSSAVVAGSSSSPTASASAGTSSSSSSSSSSATTMTTSYGLSVIPVSPSPALTSSSSSSTPTGGGVFFTGTVPGSGSPSSAAASSTFVTSASSAAASSPAASSPASQAASSSSEAASPQPTGSGSSSGSSSGSNSSSGSAGKKTGACTQTGDWNCIDSTSFQRCASGQWSAVEQMAAGTKCKPGVSSNLEMLRRRDRVRTHGYHGWDW
ncbi:hypothetical protein GGR56DRAFT_15100 [Xylariaceae sp. FL0804]|nr:hypothetical protein GGR56DRAFT_15100 [Xylariaceae sp. FL0804]